MHVLATDAAVNALERVRRGDPKLEVPTCPFAFLYGKPGRTKEAVNPRLAGIV